jgi:long-subunit acyl-CoA synthetase (AMP-forming)
MQVTKESFTDDGYFKTGDAVTTDKDGYFIILGRKEIYFSKYDVWFSCVVM